MLRSCQGTTSDLFQKLKAQCGWSIARERRVNKDDVGEVIRSQIMGDYDSQGKYFEIH